MSATRAAHMHTVAARLEESADVCRWQVAFYEAAKTAAGDSCEWERFVELTKRGQALAMETAQLLDALSAEASAIADRLESEPH